MLVFVFSLLFNLSRWFELKTEQVTVTEDVTMANGSTIEKNVTRDMVKVRLNTPTTTI